MSQLTSDAKQAETAVTADVAKVETAVKTDVATAQTFWSKYGSTITHVLTAVVAAVAGHLL